MAESTLSVTVEIDRDSFTDKLKQVGPRRLRRSLRDALEKAADIVVKEISVSAELE